MNPHTIVGNTSLWNNLQASLASQSFPHASLFIDNGQFGALPLALRCAQKLLGKDDLRWEQWADLYMMFPFVKHGSANETHEEHLDSWRSFVQENLYGSQWDWTQFLESGNKQLIIPVAAVLEMQRKIHLKAFEGQNKVCIVWGADLLHEKAANKMLKILEEPPTDTYFILIAEETSEMLPTLLSRCQQSTLVPVADTEIEQGLASLNIEKAQMTSILFQAEGSMGRALQLCQQASGTESFENLWVIGLRAAFRARGNKAIVLELLEWAENLSRLNRETHKAFLTYGLRLFRAALMHNYGSASLGNFVSETGFDIKKLAPFIHGENVLEIIELLQDYTYALERNVNAKMLFTDLAFKLTRLLHQRETA